ncbi:MAG: alginate export family protein [Spirochaetes bacterium]|nr:alginate export family protein [Spirochaetota bacterium]
MISKKIFFIIILFSFVFNISLYAQVKKTVDVKKTKQTEGTETPSVKSENIMEAPAATEPFSISYGGWITTAVIDQYSSNTSNLISSVSMARIWLKTTLPYNSHIYLRGKDVYTYYIKQPEDADNKNENNIDLDVGYFYMSLLNNSINYSVGRKFYILGSGIIFNGRGDGGEFNYYSKYADLKLFGAYTGFLNKDSNPYKLVSDLYTDDGKRIFAGGTISKSFYNQTFYLSGLFQMDKNDEMDDTSYPDAESTYNSQYYAIGFKGTFKNAFYFGEYIIERGESYTGPESTTKKQDIKASAATLNLNYYFSIMLRPVLVVQYAYGSGDSDKNNPSSPTGNTDKDDKGFMYFGSYSGGYALRPYLSNIHIYRIGAAISPLSNSNNIMLKRINLSAIYSNYQKDVANSTINAGEATEPNKDIGHGFDVGLTWQIFSDLSFFGNYAVFVPGSAYASGEKNRTFIMGGINLSF